MWFVSFSTRPKWELRTRRRVLPTLAVLLIAVSACLWSQGNAYLTGYVHDPTGATIPNASVTIENEGTGGVLELKTNETGVYRSPGLEPGNYEVRVIAAGFQEIGRAHV